jgi:hypothetical protein
MLFSDSSLLTMLHGLALSGSAMMALAAALFGLYAMAAPDGAAVPARQGNGFAWLLGTSAVLFWLAVLVGTYVVFPIYRAPPPEGALVLDAYPRALLLSRADTRWLHAFAMEVKEHTPWIGAMLATAAAFIAVRYRTVLLADRSLRQVTGALTGVAFAIVLFAALLGVFVNKTAPVW